MNKKNLFVIGDSISIQYGPYLKKMVNGVFEYDRKKGAEQDLKDLDNPVGANGGDSRMVLNFLKEQSDNKVNYNILTLNCGLHDIKKDKKTGRNQIEIDEYEENIKEISNLAKKMAHDVIWVSTTPVDDYLHNILYSQCIDRYNKDVIEYNNAANYIMNENSVPIIDLYSFTKNLGDSIYCDHVHYVEEVRALQAAFIAGGIYGIHKIFRNVTK